MPGLDLVSVGGLCVNHDSGTAIGAKRTSNARAENLVEVAFEGGFQGTASTLETDFCPPLRHFSEQLPFLIDLRLSKSQATPP